MLKNWFNAQREITRLKETNAKLISDVQYFKGQASNFENIINDLKDEKTNLLAQQKKAIKESQQLIKKLADKDLEISTLLQVADKLRVKIEDSKSEMLMITERHQELRFIFDALLVNKKAVLTVLGYIKDLLTEADETLERHNKEELANAKADLVFTRQKAESLSQKKTFMDEFNI